MASPLYGCGSGFWGWSRERTSSLKYLIWTAFHPKRKVREINYYNIKMAVWLTVWTSWCLLSLELSKNFFPQPSIGHTNCKKVLGRGGRTCRSPWVSRCFLRAGISVKSFLQPEWWLHLYKSLRFSYWSLSRSEIPFLSPLLEVLDLLRPEL